MTSTRKRPQSEMPKPSKIAEPAGGVDLREIFKAPDEAATDSDINNPWNFRSWWNTIQAQDSSDYMVHLAIFT